MDIDGINLVELVRILNTSKQGIKIILEEIVSCRESTQVYQNLGPNKFQSSISWLLFTFGLGLNTY